MSFVDYIKEEAMKVFKTFEEGGDPLTYIVNKFEQNFNELFKILLPE